MAEVPRELDLVVRQTWTIRLDRSGGGYRWDADVRGEPGVVKVAVEYAEGPAERGSEAVTITGVKPGEVEVQLTQRRPWERADDARRGQAIRVRVVAGRPRPAPSRRGDEAAGGAGPIGAKAT